MTTICELIKVLSELPPYCTVFIEQHGKGPFPIKLSASRYEEGRMILEPCHELDTENLPFLKQPVKTSPPPLAPLVQLIEKKDIEPKKTPPQEEKPKSLPKPPWAQHCPRVDPYFLPENSDFMQENTHQRLVKSSRYSCCGSNVFLYFPWDGFHFYRCNDSNHVNYTWSAFHDAICLKAGIEKEEEESE